MPKWRWPQEVQLNVYLLVYHAFSATPAKLFKGMAGTTGLEPAASAVTVLRVMLRRMRRDRRNLHECNGMGHLSPSTARTEQHQFTPLCMGMDTRVTSQLMSQKPRARVTARTDPRSVSVLSCREMFSAQV
jgi:hypothetical protein